MPIVLETVNDDVRAVRQRVGLWLRDDATFVRIAGPDAAEWLQSQTTNDVAALESGQGHANALLDRKGRLQGHFTLHRWEDEYWMLVDAAQSARVLQQLEDHLFIERVTIEETGGELDQLVLQGPSTVSLLFALMGLGEAEFSQLVPARAHEVHPIELLGYDVLAFRESYSGEDGYVLVLERGEGEALFEELAGCGNDFGLRVISPDAREVLRIEAGLPRFGTDIDDGCTIAETSLEPEAVSFEKGCYLGQEVVARLKAYGSPKKALMGLMLDGEVPCLGPMSIEGKGVGRVTSATISPTLERPIALAMLDRDHRTPGTRLSFEIDGVAQEATVQGLPFVSGVPRESRARALYDEALTLFEDDLDDTDTSAIPLLQEAIVLQPDFEDAYEVLGVILHRHGRVDEAIRYMRMLVELNPDCMMAHTNLSVFYVAKGMIQEAEEEKAKAAVLGIQHASDERRAKELAEEERARIRAEALERIGMFEEVLELDPEDPLATFGMGKAYVQLDDYESAVPHLQRAVEVQPDYSAAWLDLGKCLEFVGRTAEAIGAYRKGIEAASRKGDLMPMREMERRLALLEAP